MFSTLKFIQLLTWTPEINFHHPVWIVKVTMESVKNTNCSCFQLKAGPHGAFYWRALFYTFTRGIFENCHWLFLLIPISGSAIHNSRFSPHQLFGDLQKRVSQTAHICFRLDSFLFNLPARKLVNTASSFKLPSTLHFGSTVAKSLRVVTFVSLASLLHMWLFVALKLSMHSQKHVCT